MSFHERPDSDDRQPPEWSRCLEGNVSFSDEDVIDGKEGDLSAAEPRRKPDSWMEVDDKETLEEPPHVSKETLKNRDGVQSTAGIFPEEEVKQPEGGEDEDELAKNPMLNQVVLTRMFALCPLKYLEKFRLVCKLWNELTLQRWRSEVTYSFTSASLFRSKREFWYDPPEILPKFSSEPGEPESFTSTVQKFLHYVHNPVHDCHKLPFRRFHLTNWLMRPRSNQVHQFYSMCAQNISHLQLDSCEFRSVGEFREICFSKFPNLQRFMLKNWKFSKINVRGRMRIRRDPVEPEPSSYSEPERCQTKLKYLEIDLNGRNLPIFWLELLSHYPNLTGFKVYNARVSIVEKYLTAIKIIRNHDPRLLKITDLDILCGSFLWHGQRNIHHRLVLLLMEVMLPLENLTMEFGWKKRVMEIKDILTWFAPTLRKLDAHRGSAWLLYRAFPFGVNLERLEELVMSHKLCQSMEFLKYTPNLKKLWICEGVKESPPMVMTEILQNTGPRELTNVKLSSVVELRFDYVLSAVLPETRLLIETFPNVKKLRMPMNNEQFKLVCEGWRDTLVELEVLGNMLTDSAITGLSAEDVINFNEAEERNSMDGGSEGEEFSGVNLEGAVVEHPNLTDSTNLRTITMVNTQHSPTRLMDCSAFYGFLKLPRLESLQLHSLMRERAQKALKAKLFTAEFIVPRRERLSNWEVICYATDDDSVLVIPATP